MTTQPESEQHPCVFCGTLTTDIIAAVHKMIVHLTPGRKRVTIPDPLGRSDVLVPRPAPSLAQPDLLYGACAKGSGRDAHGTVAT